MSEENNSTSNNNIEQCSIFSEQDKELANKAKQEYKAGQYDRSFHARLYSIIQVSCFVVLVCLKTLQKILESCPNDTKVLFNIALTEYALSSFQKTDVFKAQLQKLAERVRQCISFIIGESHVKNDTIRC
jgi:hypothetical protein